MCLRAYFSTTQPFIASIDKRMAWLPPTPGPNCAGMGSDLCTVIQNTLALAIADQRPFGSTGISTKLLCEKSLSARQVSDIDFLPHSMRDGSAGVRSCIGMSNLVSSAL